MHEDHAENNPQTPKTNEGSSCPLWVAPRLTRYGALGDVTQGIGYLSGDGIENLTT